MLGAGMASRGWSFTAADAEVLFLCLPRVWRENSVVAPGLRLFFAPYFIQRTNLLPFHPQEHSAACPDMQLALSEARMIRPPATVARLELYSWLLGKQFRHEGAQRLVVTSHCDAYNQSLYRIYVPIGKVIP